MAILVLETLSDRPSGYKLLNYYSPDSKFEIRADINLQLLLWICFWGPAHCHFWKFRKINDVLFIEIDSYT